MSERIEVWPLSRAHEALERTLGGTVSSVGPPGAPLFDSFAASGDVGDFAGTTMMNWVRETARTFGFDARISVVLPRTLRPDATNAPGMILWPDGLLPFVNVGQERFRVIGNDGRMMTVNLRGLLDATRRGEIVSGEFDEMLAGLPKARRIRDALTRAHSAADDAHGRMILCEFFPSATRPLGSLLAERGIVGHLATFAGATVLQIAAGGGAAWTLGSSMLNGQVDTGRIIAWSMLSLSIVPLGVIGVSALGNAQINVSHTLKRRLLEGTFHASESTIRSNGYGATIARTQEAGLIEQQAVIGAASATAPIAQWVAGLVFFAHVPGILAWIFYGLSAVFVLALGLFGRAHVRAYFHAYDQRTLLADDIVEKLMGYRTRIVQENPRLHHFDEDRSLAAYASTSRVVDRTNIVLTSMARAWLVVSGIVLGVFFAQGASADALFWSALGTVSIGAGLGATCAAVQQGITLANAWRCIRWLVRAGRRDPLASAHGTAHDDDGRVPVVVAVSSLSFRYGPGHPPIFSGANLRVRAGDRVLVQGRSGGGKSTLAKLLGGEYPATGGTVLIGGRDVQSVSQAEWRRRVASAPQFHENHIFSNTLAFNIDPVRGDLADLSEEARQICSELGLDDVIGRMPQSVAQVVGETGWQLSHGERSRVFIARALLQGAELLIFDESFAALDPELLAQAMACVRRRAKSLVVIAHP